MILCVLRAFSVSSVVKIYAPIPHPDLTHFMAKVILWLINQKTILLLKSATLP